MAQKAVGVRLDGLVAPHQDDAGRLPVGVRVAVGVGLRGVHDDHVAVLRRRADHARQVAGEAGEPERGDIRRLHAGRREVGDLPANIAAGAMHDHDGFRSVLLFDGEYALGDLIVGLVPADALPPVLAALAGAAQGVLQAVGVVHRLGKVEAAHAQLAVGNGVQRIALNAFELAVLRVQQHAAAHVAARWRPVRRAGDGVAVLLPLPFPFVVGLAVELFQKLSVVGHGAPFSSHAARGLASLSHTRDSREDARRRHAVGLPISARPAAVPWGVAPDFPKRGAGPADARKRAHAEGAVVAGRHAKARLIFGTSLIPHALSSRVQGLGGLCWARRRVVARKVPL